MRYEGDEIYDVIPNRRPLMILDCIDIIDDSTAEGLIKLKEDAWYFECHYPGNPIFPVCLLVESMTQIFTPIFFNRTREIPVIYSLGAVKVNVGATIGEEIRLIATVNSNKRGVIAGKCEAYKMRDGREVLMTSIDITEVLKSDNTL